MSSLRIVVFAVIVTAVSLIANPVDATDTEHLETYTHPDLGFSLDYPESLIAVAGRREEETMPSQEFEWHFPNGAEGQARLIFLGFYDMPLGETVSEWIEAEINGEVETLMLGADGSIPAFKVTSMDSWAYQSDVFIPHSDAEVVVNLLLVIQIATRGSEGGMGAIEAEHADDVDTFMELVRSYELPAGD